VKNFRKIVPQFALAICAGLLLSIACYAGTVGTTEPEKLNEVNQLSFQSVQFDAQSLFTRQSGDGETESLDETLRQDNKVFNALVTRELSQSASSAVLIITSQQPPIHIPGGNRCILYSRLTL
jgi:hypothetical protein